MATPIAEAVPTQLCDARQFQRFGDHCYLVASYPEVSWPTAERICSESQATLASVRTAAQETFLKTLVLGVEGYASGVWYWLGGRKATGRGADAGAWVDDTRTASAENSAAPEPPSGALAEGR